MTVSHRAGFEKNVRFIRPINNPMTSSTTSKVKHERDSNELGTFSFFLGASLRVFTPYEPHPKTVFEKICAVRSPHEQNHGPLNRIPTIKWYVGYFFSEGAPSDTNTTVGPQKRYSTCIVALLSLTTLSRLLGTNYSQLSLR